MMGSRVGNVTKMQNVSISEDVSCGGLTEKHYKKWCLRTDSNRHEDRPQGILSHENRLLTSDFPYHI